MTTATRTKKDYWDAFDREVIVDYPTIDAFEEQCGYRVDLMTRLDPAARVLACPLKPNPPNWQHGRVLYSSARKYFATMPQETWINTLDIGTAKGFSALCVQWALNDSGRRGQVVSVDVLNPYGVESRNTVAELDGPVTLAQILEPWPEADAIEFHRSTGVDYLKTHVGRIHFAFVDGKHAGAVVGQEAALIAKRQEPGDLVIFDDAHMPDVASAIETARANYQLASLIAKPGREYMLARRR